MTTPCNPEKKTQLKRYHDPVLDKECLEPWNGVFTIFHVYSIIF